MPISNKIPPKTKMDRLKFKLEIVEESAAFPPTYKSILTDEEDNSVVIPPTKNRIVIIHCCTCHGIYLGHSRIKGLTCIAIFDVLMTFQDLASADLKTTKAVRKHVKNAMVIYTCQK
ncbi:hypothetical protein TNCV_4160191 [Trichonephila clavipes]|nr:hypothetical protein TNCV_4160191 [Trichonephila clavipes]